MPPSMAFLRDRARGLGQMVSAVSERTHVLALKVPRLAAGQVGWQLLIPYSYLWPTRVPLSHAMIVMVVALPPGWPDGMVPTDLRR